MSENETSPLRDRLSAVIRSRAAAQTDWLKTLASFESTRGNEAPCQDWLADEFAARGWAVDKYRLGDVEMAALPGFSPVAEADYAEAIEVVAQPPAGISGRSLILQGHIDVVPPGPREQWAHDPFAPEIHNGFMSGRGVSDMKAGVT
jgi:acetylornithine deacetylase